MSRAAEPRRDDTCRSTTPRAVVPSSNRAAHENLDKSSCHSSSMMIGASPRAHVRPPNNTVRFELGRLGIADGRAPWRAHRRARRRHLLPGERGGACARARQSGLRPRVRPRAFRRHVGRFVGAAVGALPRAVRRGPASGAAPGGSMERRGSSRERAIEARRVRPSEAPVRRSRGHHRAPRAQGELEDGAASRASHRRHPRGHRAHRVAARRGRMGGGARGEARARAQARRPRRRRGDGGAEAPRRRRRERRVVLPGRPGAHDPRPPPRQSRRRARQVHRHAKDARRRGRLRVRSPDGFPPRRHVRGGARARGGPANVPRRRGRVDVGADCPRRPREGYERTEDARERRHPHLRVLLEKAEKDDVLVVVVEIRYPSRSPRAGDPRGRGSQTRRGARLARVRRRAARRGRHGRLDVVPRVECIGAPRRIDVSNAARRRDRSRRRVGRRGDAHGDARGGVARSREARGGFADAKPRVSRSSGGANRGGAARASEPGAESDSSDGRRVRVGASRDARGASTDEAAGLARVVAIRGAVRRSR